MKYLIMILILGLTACSGKSGNDGVSQNNQVPVDPSHPTCKSLYDIWESNTDSTQFIFIGLENSAIDTNYTFYAGDATMCGFDNTSAFKLSSQILVAPKAPNGSMQFDYLDYMTTNTSLASSCSIYSNGSVGNYGIGIIQSACNELTICSFGGTNCKLFH